MHYRYNFYICICHAAIGPSVSSCSCSYSCSFIHSLIHSFTHSLIHLLKLALILDNSNHDVLNATISLAWEKEKRKQREICIIDTVLQSLRFIHSFIHSFPHSFIPPQFLPPVLRLIVVILRSKDVNGSGHLIIKDVD